MADRNATGYDANAPGRKAGYANLTLFCFKNKAIAGDAINDVITMGVIPAGVTILGGWLRTDLLAALSTMDIGTTSGGAELASALVTSAANTLQFDVVNLGTDPIDHTTTETTIYAQHLVAAPTAGTTYEIIILGLQHQPNT